MTSFRIDVIIKSCFLKQLSFIIFFNNFCYCVFQGIQQSSKNKYHVTSGNILRHYLLSNDVEVLSVCTVWSIDTACRGSRGAARSIRSWSTSTGLEGGLDRSFSESGGNKSVIELTNTNRTRTRKNSKTFTNLNCYWCGWPMWSCDPVLINFYSCLKIFYVLFHSTVIPKQFWITFTSGHNLHATSYDL